KELLAQLSLLRGSLKSFEGDKGSSQYQNRIKKINIVEKALLNNPAVTEAQKKITQKDTPFLYSKETDQIILTGDLFFSYGMPYEIVRLNFKKREFTGKPLREDKRDHQPSYSPYAQPLNLNRAMSVVEMKSARGFTYYPQPSREDKKRILTIDTKDFYQIDDEAFKETYYDRHLKACYNNTDFTPIQFFICPDNGKLLIQDHEPYTTDDNGKPLRPLNPFNETDRERIHTALKIGVEFDNKYRQDSHLDAIGQTLPKLRQLIEKAITREGREVAEPGPLLKENTPENFRENLINLGKRPGYRNNVMAAAQYLIRTARPSDRERLRGTLRSLGCTDPQSTKAILTAWIQEGPLMRRGMTTPEPAMGR
ncbi:MAG: hypothetical protein LBP74_09800, partial [Treponema sp.]|nr:hypothetical protein [Treponema sp.]